MKKFIQYFLEINKMYTKKVSVLCATYNRHHFLHLLLYQFNYQTYPSHLMELIILDDSDNKINDPDLKDKLQSDHRINYIYDDVKKEIWEKRNILNNLATGDIIVWMDDDDIYFNTRVEHSVLLLSKKKSNFAGCNNTIMYYVKNKQCRFLTHNKCANHTMSYDKSYLDTHSYNYNGSNYNEECSFTNNYTVPMILLNPYHTCIHVSHGKNTVKKQLANGQHRLDISKIINDEYILNFLYQLSSK